MHLGMKNPSFKGFKIALLAVLFTVAAAFNPRPFAVDDEGVNIIVIDPGHGGRIQATSEQAATRTVKKMLATM